VELFFEHDTEPSGSINFGKLFSLILQPRISRPVCLGIKHPSGAYDQIFITVRQLHVR
jgi:hypothetical protein